MNKFPMTPEGYETLQSELDHLKNHERHQISKAIGEARELGDLKENAEYHAAKERQGLIEARIRYLEERLTCAQVIDISKMPNDGRIIFGTTVTLKRSDGTTFRYHIVGEDEADIHAGKLSIVSPLARAAIGRYVDDVVMVDAPEGDIEYTIEAVDYQREEAV